MAQFKIDRSKLEKAANAAQIQNSKFAGGPSTKWFTFKGTSARLRFMPPWTDQEPWDGQFWRVVEQHWHVSEEQKAPLICPKNTPFLGGDCPVCDFVAELKLRTDDTAAQELVKEIRSKTAYLFSVIDLDNPEYTAKDVAEAKAAKPDKEPSFKVGDPKLQVYAAPFTVYNTVIALFKDGSDIVDLEAGHDINIMRTGKEKQTKYTITPNLRPTRSAVPLDTVMPDLSKVGMVLSVERMSELLAGGIGGEYQQILDSGKEAAKLVENTKNKAKPAPKKEEVDDTAGEEPVLGGLGDDEEDEDLEAQMMKGNNS